MTPDQVVRIAASAMTAGLAILALAPNSLVATIGAALGGGGWTLTHSTYNTTVQLSAPAWVTARSLALYQTATFAGMALGSIVFGWVAEHQTVSVALLAASGAHAVAAVVGVFLPLPRYQDLQVDPLDIWKPPALGLEIADGEGPVFVELDYRIAPENQASFLAAMGHRERIRKRDGARDWSLWQDVHDRDRWIECYHVKDWSEYLRHNQRRTQADRENADTLRALSADPNGPVVRRHLRRGG